MKPNYQSYTLEELYDVHSNIDRESYPERYLEIVKEIELRESNVSQNSVKGDMRKPKRKRTNKERIITSSLIFVAASFCIYYEKIPGKHGGLSMNEDPYFFWGTWLFCVGLAVNQLLTLESNQKQSDSDT